MPIEILLALVGFAFVATATPGPNNFMVLASGLNHGLMSTMPHILGVVFGFALLLICLGFGLGQVLQNAPIAYTLLKFAGAAYLVYLAYRIAISGPVKSGDLKGKPFTFLQAAAFQWVNPKAWAMGVAAITVYTSTEDFLFTLPIVISVFALVALPSLVVWCGMGSMLRNLLTNPRSVRIFNVAMAAVLVASLWPMLR